MSLHDSVPAVSVVEREGVVKGVRTRPPVSPAPSLASEGSLSSVAAAREPQSMTSMGQTGLLQVSESQFLNVGQRFLNSPKRNIFELGTPTLASTWNFRCYI